MPPLLPTCLIHSVRPIWSTPLAFTPILLAVFGRCFLISVIISHLHGDLPCSLHVTTVEYAVLFAFTMVRPGVLKKSSVLFWGLAHQQLRACQGIHKVTLIKFMVLSEDGEMAFYQRFAVCFEIGHFRLPTNLKKEWSMKLTRAVLLKYFTRRNHLIFSLKCFHSLLF